jgi:hypothetical protein
VDHHDHSGATRALEGRQRSGAPHRHHTLTDRGDDEQREEEDDEQGADVDGASIRTGTAGQPGGVATLALMDGILDWYLLGVVVGLGVTDGAAAAGALRRLVYALLALAAVAAAIVVTALALPWWALGAFVAASLLAWVAFRRLSLDALPAAVLGSLLLAALPATGYLLALAAPVAGARLGRRAASRYAGLRVLARD